MANDDGAAASTKSGHISRLILRVTEVDRAAAFFGGLFSWQLEEAELSAHLGKKARALCVPTPSCMGAVFVADPHAPSVRVEFGVTDSARAMAHVLQLGGSGTAAEAADSQGVPLAFVEAGKSALPRRPHSGDIGVLIFDVPDTALARAFHSGLFGRSYHRIGTADRWWMNDLTVGVFRAPASGVRFWHVVPELEPVITKVLALGGTIVERGAMGPYQVCACRDDQGTAFRLWYDANLQFESE